MVFDPFTKDVTDYVKTKGFSLNETRGSNNIYFQSFSREGQTIEFRWELIGRKGLACDFHYKDENGHDLKINSNSVTSSYGRVDASKKLTTLVTNALEKV